MGEESKREEQPISTEQNGREDLENRLLQEGFGKEDIETSVKLIGDISGLNTLIFGDKIPIFYFEPLDEKHITSYTPAIPEQNIEESYYVYIRTIVDKVENLRKKLNLWFDEGGKLRTGEIKDRGQQVTFDEFLLGIAAHEVRHRVQRLPEFSKIDTNKEKKKESDASIIEYKAIRALHKGKSMEQISEIIAKLD